MSDKGETVRLSFFRRDVRVSLPRRRYPDPPVQPDGRGEMSGFSPESMARLVWVANNTLQEWNSLLTVTYPESWPMDQRESKEHLRMLLQSIRRKFKGAVNLWVREFQQRGAPHYHILLSTPIVGRFRKYRKPAGCKGPAPSGSVEMHTWVSFEWQRLIGQYGSEKGLRAGCRWERLRSRRGGAAYLATYFGKEEQKQVPPGVEAPGRWWGHSQTVGDIEPDYAIDVPASRYFREVDGAKTSKAGWLFATLHDGRRRCAAFLADQAGGTLTASARVVLVGRSAKLPPMRGGTVPDAPLRMMRPQAAPRAESQGSQSDDDPDDGDEMGGFKNPPAKVKNGAEHGPQVYSDYDQLARGG